MKHALIVLITVAVTAALSALACASLDATPADKQWLIMLSPATEGVRDGSDPEAVKAVGEHFQRLVRLRDAGQVLLAGRTMDDDSIGLVIFTAPNAEAAEAFMNEDPAVSRGFMHAKLHPYAVAIEGFTRE